MKNRRLLQIGNSSDSTAGISGILIDIASINFNMAADRWTKPGSRLQLKKFSETKMTLTDPVLYSSRQKAI